MHLLPSNDASPSSNACWPNGPDPALVAGIAAYRRHPYARSLRDPPELWREGGSRMLDFGGAGPGVLFVPSLVNRAYVLDLSDDRSMLRWLASRGVRPLLLDWGWPGVAERQFSLTDYIAGRLDRAVAAIGRPVVLAGYCMGGLLALALALRRPELVAGLALLATPWNFHAPDPAPAMRLAAGLPSLEPAMQATGTVPVDALQAVFAALEPGQVADKYRAFGRMQQDDVRARSFVAIEDWLNDGVPLAAPVARETIALWYGANATWHGTWCVAGQPVRPAELDRPAFLAIPDRDRIVPAASAQALAIIPGAVVHQPRAGHVGMVAGSRADAELWSPLLDWLRAL